MKTDFSQEPYIKEIFKLVTSNYDDAHRKNRKDNQLDEEFEQYDFSDNESICEAIVKLNHKGLLKGQVASALVRGDDHANELAQAIIIFHKEKVPLDQDALSNINENLESYRKVIDYDSKVIPYLFFLREDKRQAYLRSLSLEEISEIRRDVEENKKEDIQGLTAILGGIKDIERLTTFKKKYMSNFNNIFILFHNPLSKMRQRILDDLLETIEDVEKYIGENPKSRTAKILSMGPQ